MIKLEHTVLPSKKQIEFVIEGTRNPMNSWDRTDSDVCSHLYPEACAYYSNEPCNNCEHNTDGFDGCCLGPNDLKLMTGLANAGSDDRKFMRMIPVYVRITAPLYWWKEFDTYKVGTVANSCSTMHKIQAKEFTLEDFSVEHLMPDSITVLEDTVIALNNYRAYFCHYDEHSNLPDKKDIWWQMIQLLPSSYNQTRNVMLNYEVLKNMYHARKNHKLDEWHEFCDWVETLPYSELITGR